MGVLVLYITRKVSAFLVPLLLGIFLGQNVKANILSSVKEKFPNCEIKQESIFPSQGQLLEIKNKNESKLKSQFFNYFIKKCSTKESFVFIHSDLVRTQMQYVLFEIEESKIKGVEIVKFLEPSEYKVGNYWLEKFRGMILGQNEIDAVSGATLTSQSVNYLSWLSLFLNDIIINYEKK